MFCSHENVSELDNARLIEKDIGIHSNERLVHDPTLPEDIAVGLQSMRQKVRAEEVSLRCSRFHQVSCIFGPQHNLQAW